MLGLVASLERGSEHPLAEAIVRGAEEPGIDLFPTDDFEAITGKGVQGRVADRMVALGNAKMLDEFGLDAEHLTEASNKRRDDGETVMFVVIDGQIVGLFSVADPVKQTTPDALRDLHALGFHIVMATGDNLRTARSVAVRQGIDEIRADVLPDEKAKIVRELQAQGRVVVMVSTTHLRWHKPMLALQWEPAPMWRSKVPDSRWSRAIYAALSAPENCLRPLCATSARISSSRWSTMQQASRWLPAYCSRSSES